MKFSCQVKRDKQRDVFCLLAQTKFNNVRNDDTAKRNKYTNTHSTFNLNPTCSKRASLKLLDK